MKIHEKLNIKKMKEDNRELPINVSIDGSESAHEVNWLNLEEDMQHDLREFVIIMSGDDAEAASREFKSLDEKKYNTRIGYASVNDNGKPNSGHSNYKKMLSILHSDKLFTQALDTTVTNKEFTATFFGFAESTEGIGDDTISDFVIFLFLDKLKEYTKMVHSYLIEPLPFNDGRIIFPDINYVAVPESLISDIGFSSVRKGTPLPMIMAISKMRVIIDSAIKNKKFTTESLKSPQQTLSLILNFVLNTKFTEENKDEHLIKIRGNGILRNEVMNLVDIKEFVKKFRIY